jgi:hypothetical protein
MTMAQFLVAIHLPDDFDYGVPNPAAPDISALNREMVAAGVRVFVGGLAPVSEAKSVVVREAARPVVTDGPYLETKEHIGGFWVLECATPEEAMAWGRKAAIACRAPVEVRAFNPPM